MLPKSFNVRQAGCCMVAARIIAGKLLQAGQAPMVIEGWIQFIDEDGSAPDDMRFAHTWVQAEDLHDPTLDQFEDYLRCYDYRREVMLEVPAAEYLADHRLNAAPEQFFEDGVIPVGCLPFFASLAEASPALAIDRLSRSFCAQLSRRQVGTAEDARRLMAEVLAASGLAESSESYIGAAAYLNTVILRNY